jgi:hypothetical protein
MRPGLALLLLPIVAVAACGEPVSDDHFANTGARAETSSPPVRHEVAVRVGEMGPSFDACVHAGTTRHVGAGERLPVRAAPFESAEETGGIPAGGRFFVCSRSQDQKWLGIVYDGEGALSNACGVSSPSVRRQDYAGPCRSGWVSSALVRLIAGIDQAPPENQPPSR